MSNVHQMAEPWSKGHVDWISRLARLYACSRSMFGQEVVYETKHRQVSA